MTDVKLVAEIGKKAISEAAAQVQLKEQSLSKEIAAHKGLSEANTVFLERREAARIKMAEMKSWISEINPNFDPFDPRSEYGNNCGSCALAVHNRLKGYKDVVAGRINIAPQDKDMEELTGLKCVYMNPSDIEKILVNRGAGSELIVGINRYDGPGHWFNVFYDGNEIYTVDGQNGKIMDWPHDYQHISAWCALV